MHAFMVRSRLAVAAAAALLLGAPVALAYPDTKEECDDAGGKWVERDLEGGGCASFCYLRLEPDAAGLSNGGGGGGVGGVGGLATALQGRYRRALARATDDALVGDVSVALGPGRLAAAGSTTCELDRDALAADGTRIGVVHVATIDRFAGSDGRLVRLPDAILDVVARPVPGTDLVRVELRSPPRRHGGGGAVVLEAEGRLEAPPSAPSSVPGGEATACWRADALKLRWTSERASVGVSLPLVAD